MFVEKLTDEEIKDFLKARYSNYQFSFSRYSDEIDVSVTNTHSLPDDYTWNEVYKDFEASNNNGPWVRFLAKKFGEEYKTAYAKFCIRIFDD